MSARRRELFLRQAAYCDGRSPLYAALCRRLAGEPAVDGIVPALRWDDPLRLLAAVHWLVLRGEAPELERAYAGSGDAWPPLRELLGARRDELAAFCRERHVQTNEVQRCAALLGGFLEIARRVGVETPLDLVELGPSAGLNLVWDRYCYRLAGGSWGPGDAPLVIEARTEPGPPPGVLALRPRVRRRLGIDLDPVDVRSEDGALLLEAWVWADQHERRARVRAAVEAVRSDPPELLRGDYVELLPGVLADRPGDGLTVVFQTASVQYLEDDAYARVLEALAEAGRDRPLAWLTTLRHDETPVRHGYALGLRLWPDGEPEVLAVFDYHGEWVSWQAA